MVDDKPKKTTVRIPQPALDDLRSELHAFTSDTGRIQYLIQRYLEDDSRSPQLLRAATGELGDDTDCDPPTDDECAAGAQ